jgi:hypothetical protein
MNVALAVLPLVSLLAAAPTPFDEQKKSATSVDRLASTVAALVGVCPDGLVIDEFEECKKNLSTAAATWSGKKVYLNLGAAEPQLLSFEAKVGDDAKFVWAPLLDLGNGLGLTVGKPDKLSDQGNIVVKKRPFAGKSDPELLESDLERAAKTGQVGVELVGTFGTPWQLNGKGKTVRGVAFAPTMIRFYHTRTGKLLAEVAAP